MFLSSHFEPNIIFINAYADEQIIISVRLPFFFISFNTVTDY